MSKAISELLEKWPSTNKVLWTRSCAACCRWPCFGRRVGLDDHRGPFQPLPFCDSVILWNSWGATTRCVASQINSHYMEQAWTHPPSHPPLQIQGTVTHWDLWFKQSILTLPRFFEIDSGIWRKGKKMLTWHPAHEQGLETCTLSGCRLLIVHPHFVYFCIVDKTECLSYNFCTV